MKRKVILTCAVTGNAPFNPKHPNFPVSPKEIAAACEEAAQAGASAVHCHVRDEETLERCLVEAASHGAIVAYTLVGSGLRVRAACAAGEMRAVDMARWPATLEPWLDAATRARALPPAWAPDCDGARAPEGGLRIVGVCDGETQT